jgi:peroxiredoxin Q/BCP
MERATFLIDANGVIRQVWHKVRVAGHVEAVFEAGRSLSGAS